MLESHRYHGVRYADGRQTMTRTVTAYERDHVGAVQGDVRAGTRAHASVPFGATDRCSASLTTWRGECGRQRNRGVPHVYHVRSNVAFTLCYCQHYEMPQVFY